MDFHQEASAPLKSPWEGEVTTIQSCMVFALFCFAMFSGTAVTRCDSRKDSKAREKPITHKQIMIILTRTTKISERSNN